MAFKFVAFAALIAVARAGVLAPAISTYAAAPALSYAAPIARVAAVPALARAAVAVDADYDPNPQYNYAYSVSDALTGDNKHQEESRNGDNVQGSYSLLEADGTTRTVQYTADPINGFNAVVSKSGAAVAAGPVVAARVAAPVVARVAAPVAYAAAPVAYRAPVAVARVASPLAYAAAPAVVKTSYASPYATYVH